MFEARPLDIFSDKEKIIEFCSICGVEGITNNRSLEAIKIGVFKDDKWFAIFSQQKFNPEKLVSISGCYPDPSTEKKLWRVLFRTATLPDFRSKAGAFTRNLNHEFAWSQLLPLQIKHGLANGAERFFFSTNTNQSGDTKSNRVDQFVQKVLVPKGQVHFLKKELSYGVIQNFWEICR